MKKLILLAIMFGAFQLALAQKQSDIYAFRYDDTDMHRWDEGTADIISIPQQIDRAEKWLKFELRYQKKNGWVYKILNSNSSRSERSTAASKNQTKSIHYVDISDNDSYFWISDNELKTLAITGFKEPSIIALDGFIVPMKLRFSNKQGGDFDMTQAINIGLVFNWRFDKWGMLDNKSVLAVFGFNATSVTVDEKTVPGIYTTKAQAVALSPILGIKIKYDKIEFGLLSGLDILTGAARKSWLYRKSPWLGITLSTSLTTLVQGEVK